MDLTAGSIGWLNEQIKSAGFSLRGLAGVALGPGPQIIQRMFGEKGKQEQENLPGLATGSEELEKALEKMARQDFGANMRKGMELMMRSMRQDIGPPAQFGTELAGVWRQATLAGLNEDPIAAEQKRIMLEQLDRLDQMLAEMKRREAQYN